MAKLTRGGFKAVEISEIEDIDDARLRIVLLLGPTISERVRSLGNRRKVAVSGAIKAGLETSLQTFFVRLSAPLPIEVVARLGAVADERRTSKGRLLLAGLSRYVNDEGDILKDHYPNRRRPYPYSMVPDRKLMQIQIAVSNAQAQGFRNFCRSNGMTHVAFFALETERILTSKARGYE